MSRPSQVIRSEPSVVAGVGSVRMTVPSAFLMTSDPAASGFVASICVVHAKVVVKFTDAGASIPSTRGAAVDSAEKSRQISSVSDVHARWPSPSVAIGPQPEHGSAVVVLLDRFHKRLV